MVAKELRSGRTIKLWTDQLGSYPPFPINQDTLFVAYMASAELNCFGVLGWKMPARILDLYVEYRCIRCWYISGNTSGLLSALSHYDIKGIEGAEKTIWRDIAIRG